MSSKKNKVKYKSKFQDVWLEDEEFKVWLQKEKVDTQAYCTLCKKSFSIVTHGKMSISLHASGEKHKARILSATQRTLLPFATSSAQQKDDVEEKTKTNETKIDDTVSKKTSRSSYFISEEVTDAEIL